MPSDLIRGWGPVRNASNRNLARLLLRRDEGRADGADLVLVGGGSSRLGRRSRIDPWQPECCHAIRFAPPIRNGGAGRNAAVSRRGQPPLQDSPRLHSSDMRTDGRPRPFRRFPLRCQDEHYRAASYLRGDLRSASGAPKACRIFARELPRTAGNTRLSRGFYSYSLASSEHYVGRGP